MSDAAGGEELRGLSVQMIEHQLEAFRRLRSKINEAIVVNGGSIDDHTPDEYHAALVRVMHASPEDAELVRRVEDYLRFRQADSV